MSWETALGSDLAGVWESLVRGEVGLRLLLDEVPARNQLAAALPQPPPGHDHRTRHVALALSTGTAALADAQLTELADTQLILGTSLGPHADDPMEGTLYTWAEEVNAGLGLQLPPVAVSTACSAGGDSLATAASLLAVGAATRCLVGAVDLVTPAKRLGHSSLGTMTSSVPRSFDAERDGMLLGEGSAFIVLEPLSMACARGARVHGVLAGWAASNDAFGMTAPDATGRPAAAAIAQALAMAQVTPADVAVVSTHGTGTVQSDAAEAACLRRVFQRQDRRPPALATKASLGHTLGATGLLEAITVLLSLRYRQAPGVAHLRQVMADFPLPLAQGAPLPVADGYGLSVTLGFGGFNSCLLLGPYPLPALAS
jgi:3-oxoacyl-[acyl-carrier-protein] synthase II